MKQKRIKDSRYWDIRLAWAAAFYFVCDAANATVKSVFDIPESLWGSVSIAFGVAIVMCYLISFKEMLRRSSSILLKTCALFIVIYGVTIFLCNMSNYPLGQTLKGTALLTFVWWIPIGIFASSVRDKSILYSVFLKASYIISITCILLYLFHNPNTEQESTEYNMSFGFKIILPLIFQMNDYLNKKRIWLLLIILLQLFLVLLFANRGPLLAVLFFCVYKFAFESNSRFKKAISITILVVVMILMQTSMQSMAEGAVAVLDRFGYQSRTLTLMASGLAEQTSGRDEIWTICYNMIMERPLLGWGLGGEYYEIAAKYAGLPPSFVTAQAYNPHNGIVQNFVCFGVFGGFIASLIVIIPFFKLKNRDKCLHELLLIFASACVVPLFVSSSGFFIKPGVAIFLFLYYYHVKNLPSVDYRNIKQN